MTKSHDLPCNGSHGDVPLPPDRRAGNAARIKLVLRSERNALYSALLVQITPGSKLSLAPVWTNPSKHRLHTKVRVDLERRPSVGYPIRLIWADGGRSGAQPALHNNTRKSHASNNNDIVIDSWSNLPTRPGMDNTHTKPMKIWAIKTDTITKFLPQNSDPGETPNSNGPK
jgi:hypothetical protein